MLNKKPDDLLGNCILDLYPQIIASCNHRNLLKALTGQTIKAMIEGVHGTYFRTTYNPVIIDSATIGLYVKASVTGSALK